MHLNVEIKAYCKDVNAIWQVLRQLGAKANGEDHQIDTYFKVSNGRLKLREGNIENALVFYDRESQKGPKKSKVVLYELPDKKTIYLLKEALTKSLGVLAVVDKFREIFFIENVKFHLDEVKDLGTFVEIEAIDKDGIIGQEKLLEQCNYYLKLFRIKKSDLIDCSYSDMLLNGSNK